MNQSENDFIVRIGKEVYEINEHMDVHRILKDGSQVAVFRDQYPTAVGKRIATLVNLGVFRV